MTTADWLDDAAALEALEPRWWALWRRVADATPFTSPAWLIPWWRAFAPGGLAMVTVHDRGELVGLAPLWLEEGAQGRRLLPLGIGVSDRFDVLLDPAASGAAGRAMGEALARRDGWETLSLEALAASAGALRLPVPGTAEDVRETTPCVALDLARGEGPALGRLPPRKREQVRLARNRSARRGEMRVTVADDEGLAAALGTLRVLHAARWGRRGEAGVLADPRVVAFHAEAAPRLLAAGLLRLAILEIDGRPAAAHYGLVANGRTSVYLTGFDPAFAFESPGVVLTAAMIDAAIAEGSTSFDFLRGREPYKYGWGAVDVPAFARILRR